MTPSKAKPRILDVGQCDMDHGAISALLVSEIGAEVDRAHSAAEALSAIEEQPYDLVLVNRIFDRDGSEGLALIRRLRQDEGGRAVPVMLVSNYADAQQAAVAAGALPGFGKARIHAPDTAELVRRALQPAQQ